MSPPSHDRLGEYRRKRAAGQTPEPFGGESTSTGGMFVVQKHAATRLHYDLRLEHDGVLLSWAVPQGPSLDPEVKRFAAQTEDHPIEYADFEGVIPKGEYGGGEMVVWDRGSLVWDEAPDAGLTAGKLLFTLHGYKLDGQWTLVRMKDPKEWLLIKKSDGWDRTDHRFDERSVYTGLTVEDLAAGVTPAEDLAAELAGTASEGAVGSSRFAPMLAEVADAAFTREGWIFEIKYDGYRLLAEKDGRTVTLRYRSGLDATAVFPEITTALRRLPYDHVLLDGEVVVLRQDGTPSFERLQRRGRLANRHDIARAASHLPATYFAFDLISAEGLDLRDLPLGTRKEVLRRVVPDIGPLRYADHVETRGEAMFDQVVAMGLEGVVAKDASSPYVSNRSNSWRKVKSERVATFAIIGYTAPKGGRHGIGALHLAGYRGGAWSYAGRVGSGFSDAVLGVLLDELGAAAIDEPVADVPTRLPTDTWVRPHLAANVRFREVTSEGVLRHPVFLRHLPLDRGDVVHLDESDERSHEPPPPAIVDLRSTEPTNTDKVFWPDDGYTKGDLIDYYTAVADHLLPYLADRPLVLDRYPDGITGGSFFQKNAPDYVPEWVRTQWVEREDGTGNNHFIVEDVESLRYIANTGAIPLHVWASRWGAIDTPDWCILDLDPKTAPFEDVVTVARAIREVCDEMGLPSFPKTSGRTGLHVLVPMGPPMTYEQQKLLGALIASVVESRHGDIATTVRMPAKRGDKVYIDHLQNGKGKLLVAPFSARPVPGATVSAPLRWSEVTPKLDIGRFTIASMPRRLSRMSDDPLAGVLTERPDILAGLSRLAAALDT